MKDTNKGLLVLHTKVQRNWIHVEKEGEVILRIKPIRNKGSYVDVMFEADREIKIYENRHMVKENTEDGETSVD